MANITIAQVLILCAFCATCGVFVGWKLHGALIEWRETKRMLKEMR